MITDTSIVEMLRESLNTPSGCLFPYRNLATGETDFEPIWEILTGFWSAVRDAFPEAWGRTPQESRLMHGVGIRAMGRLMDKVMGSLNATETSARVHALQAMERIAPHVVGRRATGKTSRSSGMTSRTRPGTSLLANFLIRVYFSVGRA